MTKRFLLILGFGVVTNAFAADSPTRDEVLLALAVPDSALPTLEGPNVPKAAPKENDPYLVSLQKYASEKPDPELVTVLLRYQLAYLSPDNALPAKVMGMVFFEQPDAFVDVFNKAPAAARVVLGQYLKFGFMKATEERNPSSPKVLAAKKKFDRLQGSLINARSRDDVIPMPAR